MVDEEDGHAVLLWERAQAAPQLEAFLAVESGGRLIEQDEPRFERERRPTPTSLRCPWEISVG